MREPYRAAVWGTGRLAGALIRMIDRLDSVELVGVRSWSPDKKGRDVGEILGMENLGVKVTLDPDEVIALRPDVVLHAARDIGDRSIDEEILELLRSGINVITAANYRPLHVATSLLEEPPWWEELASKKTLFREAATSGRATFYNTGINPDFMIERLCLTLSGLCSEVDHIYQEEVWRCDTLGKEMFDAIGMGLTLEEAKDRHAFLFLFSYYYEPCMRIVAERMGRTLDRIERSDYFTPAPKDHELQWSGPPMTLEAGRVGGCELRCEGYSGDDLFFTVVGRYYLGEHMRPPGAVADDYYIIEIEGRPSVKMSAALYASAKDGTQRYEKDPTQPGYYATAGPMIQAIPVVVDGPPGHPDSLGPPIHYLKDLRAQRL